MKRRPVSGICLALTALALTATGHAQESAYPSRPIRLVVPFAAGGAADVLGRQMAQKLSASMKQPMVVDNRPGAGGSIGSREVAGAQPDGHTLLLGTSSTHGINPWVYAKLGYDTEKDFTAISMVATTEYALAVNQNFAARNLEDLLRMAKSGAPGTISYGSAGVGTTGHLAGALLSSLARAEFSHVPYKGVDQALNDLLGGRISFMFNNVSALLPYAQSGKLRILGTSGATRAAVTKDYPSLSEAGVANYEIIGWYAILAPAGMPAAIVDILNRETGKALNSPDLQERLRAVGNEPFPGSAAQAKAFIASQLGKFKSLVEVAGAKAE